MIEILYNNINPFVYAAGVPLVSISSTSEYRNSRLYEIDTIIFRGKIKQDCLFEDYRKQLSTENYFGFLLENGVDGLAIEQVFEAKCRFLDLQNQIISKFSSNFKKLEIKQDGNTLYSSENAIIKSINFDESTYFNLVGFQVEIVCYKNKFAELGIIDPSEEFSFSDNSDGTVSMTHSISCSAINLDAKSLQNAKDFVEDRYNNSFVPASWSANKRILIEKKSSTDTLTGKISSVLVYKFSPKDFMGIFSSRECILNYTCRITEESGEILVSVNGTMQGSISSNIAYIRSGVPEIDFYSIALDFIDHLGYTIDISNKVKSFSFDENKEQSLITFDVTFSTSQYDPYVVDSFTVSNNYNENIYCASTLLTFKSNHGCPDNRMTKVKNYYSTFDSNEFINFKWAQFGNGSKIPTKTRSKSVSIDSFNSTISESKKMCSNVGIDCMCFNDLKYVLSFSGGINKYIYSPTLEGLGCYSIQDLGYSERMNFSISGSANVNDCCDKSTATIQLKGICNYISFKYFNAENKILDEESITYNENKGTVEFSYKWSGKSVIIF